jgi:hypothetical protein
VVSVFATGPKGRGFKPGRGDGFSRAIKIRSPPSSRMGSKAGRSHVRRHVKDQLTAKDTEYAKLSFFRPFLLFASDVSDGRIARELW